MWKHHTLHSFLNRRLNNKKYTPLTLRQSCQFSGSISKAAILLSKAINTIYICISIDIHGAFKLAYHLSYY